MNLKNGKVFTSKFAETGPSSYEKRIYRAAVSQRLRNTGIGLNYTGCCKENELRVYLGERSLGYITSA